MINEIKSFIRLFTMPYKRQDKADDWVSEVQSVLCEDAMCLKRAIVVWRAPLQRSVEQLSSNCYCLCKGYKQRNNNENKLLLFTLSCEQWHTELCE